jgi:hypothetical protein
VSASTRRLDRPPPLFVYRAVNAIRRFLARLVRQMVPPRVALFEQFTGVWMTQMIYVAARLEIADALSAGPKTIDELAASSGAHADTLSRLMRALVSVGIFERRRDGRFALNPVAETLRRDHVGSMRDIVLFLGSPHSMLGWAHFVDAVKTGKNGFQIAHGKPVFDYLAEHPEDEATFSGGMVSMTELDAPALVRGFDYSKFGTVCDVGGGHGLLLAAILSVNPGLRGVLFDLAHVLEKSPEVLRAWAVADRCTTTSGSFFESVPSGCDAYILKEILHDWDDARARAILSVCRRGMRPGNTLLVMEMLVSDDDRPHPAKLLDMEMLDITYEGRQRSVAELSRLFDATGFRLTRVIPLPTPTSIVEAVAC